jgi:large subunit ribosomal protein L5
MKLQEYYRTHVVDTLIRERGYCHRLAVPRVQKITLNVGLGQSIKDAKYLDAAERTLARISGQQAVKTRARVSLSNFKIRKGMVIGMKVTLRGKHMWDFLDKLIHVTLPRVRDFRGLSLKGFDGQGNYSIGFREHMAFPEIRSDEIETVHGLQVTVSTTATSPEEGAALLQTLGFPFRPDTRLT